jgi:hypothetical protein
VNGYFSSDWSGNCLNKSQREYWLYLAHRAFGEGGLKTIYWDIFFADLNGGVMTGHAYVLPDGRSQHGYAGWNARRFFMRLYALMGDHGLAPGGMMSHASNNYLLVAGGWMDAILDGEFHELTADSKVDWVDGYPIDRMRFLSTPHNWGIAMSWMDLIRPGARGKRGLQDYVKMVDTWRGPSLGSMPDSMLAFGLNGEDVEYVPLWRLGNLARAHHKDALVSLWRMPDRVIVGVFNYNRADTINVAVDVNLGALGLSGKLVNAVLLQGEADHAFASSGRLTVNKLLPHTGRFYGIRAVDREALEAFHAQYASLSRRAFLTQGVEYLTVPNAVLAHDFVRPETRYFAPGEMDRIATEEADAEIVAWQLPDRVLVGVYNAGEQGRNIALKVDLDGLGLTPELPWQEFIRCHALIGEAKFDFDGRGVTLPSVAAGTGRLFVLRRY